VLAGCGGSDTTYQPDEVQQAFREAGLPLQRLPSVGAEQPAMGETSSCATRYLVRSGSSLIHVSVCDLEEDAAQIASADTMRRANVAVEYSGYDAQIHERIDRAPDGLEG